jgi:hypothetical protein
MGSEHCFAFVGLGFTAFTERFGDERAVVVLAGFRTRVREVAARGPLEASALDLARSDVMVTDPSCGLVLPAVKGLDTRFGFDGSVQRFCSTACALSWEEGQPELPALVQLDI